MTKFEIQMERILQRRGLYDCCDINHDISHIKTGNMWIECEIKYNNTWLKSGIYSDDGYFLYVVGDINQYYILSKKQLQMIEHKHEKRITRDGLHKGFLLSIKEAKKFSIV